MNSNRIVQETLASIIDDDIIDIEVQEDDIECEHDDDLECGHCIDCGEYIGYSNTFTTKE